MRELNLAEVRHVAGGEGEYSGGSEGGDGGCEYSGKNNNGYGNGPEAGPPPGASGDHNPQLLGWNLGPRGLR
jgi:hypothetical protein